MLNLCGYVEDVRLLENKRGIELRLEGYDGFIYLHNTENTLNDVHVELEEHDDILSMKGQTLISTEERIWKDGDTTNSFYVFRTHERTYTLRFCGSSNGYYCESASIELCHSRERGNKRRLPRAEVKDFQRWEITHSYVTGHLFNLVLELEGGVELHIPNYRLSSLVKDDYYAGCSIWSVLKDGDCIVLELDYKSSEVLVPLTYTWCDVYLT